MLPPKFDLKKKNLPPISILTFLNLSKNQFEKKNLSGAKNWYFKFYYKGNWYSSFKKPWTAKHKWKWWCHCDDCKGSSRCCFDKNAVWLYSKELMKSYIHKIQDPCNCQTQDQLFPITRLRLTLFLETQIPYFHINNYRDI